MKARSGILISEDEGVGSPIRVGRGGDEWVEKVGRGEMLEMIRSNSKLQNDDEGEIS